MGWTVAPPADCQGWLGIVPTTVRRPVSIELSLGTRNRGRYGHRLWRGWWWSTLASYNEFFPTDSLLSTFYSLFHCCGLCRVLLALVLCRNFRCPLPLCRYCWLGITTWLAAWLHWMLVVELLCNSSRRWIGLCRRCEFRCDSWQSVHWAITGWMNGLWSAISGIGWMDRGAWQWTGEVWELGYSEWGMFWMNEV